MTPLVVENGPPVTFLRRKMTGGRFSMGVVIRNYTGCVPPSWKRAQVWWLNELLHSKKWKSEIQIFSLRSRGTIFCKGTFWFEEQVHWRRHRQDVRVSSWQHFRGLCRKVFQQIVGIPMGTNCAPLLADIFLYSYCTKRHSYSHCSRPVGNGWHLSSTSHIDTSTTFCPLITLTLKIILVRCIPLNLRSKTRRRATPLLPTSIYSCQSVGTVNFTLPFYDKRDDFNFNITNFPFLSSNIPSSPVYGLFISQLIRYARASSSYECFILGRCDFPISLLGRDMYRNVWDRVRGSFMVSTGILPNNMRSPLPNVTRYSGWWPSTLTPPLIRHFTNFWPYYWSGPYYRIWLLT